MQKDWHLYRSIHRQSLPGFQVALPLVTPTAVTKLNSPEQQSDNIGHHKKRMTLPLDPPCDGEAPTASVPTEYDLQHLVTYWRMLDADREAADWREVSRLVLHIEPDTDVGRARRAFESHLSRARWMADQGYRHLLLSSYP
jgi:hypothetical protein